MKIEFDKDSNRYFVTLSKDGDKSPSAYALTFEELEALGEAIHQLVQDTYSAQLQEELGGDYTCDGCSI